MGESSLLPKSKENDSMHILTLYCHVMLLTMLWQQIVPVLLVNPACVAMWLVC